MIELDYSLDTSKSTNVLKNKTIKTSNTNNSIVYDTWKKWFDDNIKYIKEELDGFFPDRYELVIKETVNNRINIELAKCSDDNINTIIRYLQTLNSTEYAHILIHFPEITIKNGGGSHIIKDMFTRISLSPILTSPYTRAGNSYFMGRRTTFTTDEKSSGYIHSHLPSGGIYPTMDFRRFCLGSTAISGNSSVLGSVFDRDNFSSMLFQMQEYLKWESIEGGPHIRFNNVRNRESTTSIPHFGVSDSIRFIKEHVNFRDIGTIKLGGDINTTLNLDDSTIKMYLSTLNLPDRYIVHEDSLGDEFPITQDVSSENSERSSNLTFKGEVVLFKVISNNVKKKTVDYKRVPNPYLVSFIKDIIKDKLQNVTNEIKSNF